MDVEQRQLKAATEAEDSAAPPAAPLSSTRKLDSAFVSDRSENRSMIDRVFGLARSSGWFEGAISDGFVEEKRRIFTGLLGCLKSGFCCSLCGSLVFVLGLGCSGSGYIVVLWFLNASVLFLRSGR